jgi:hypothetical protein
MLMGAIKTVERKLAKAAFLRADQALMNVRLGLLRRLSWGIGTLAGSQDGGRRGRGRS